MATLVKGDSKAPLSIAVTPRCRGGHYSFPWIAPHLKMLSVKQGGIKYHFLSVWYNSTWDWTQAMFGKVFTNGPGNLGSIPDRVIPKTQKKKKKKKKGYLMPLCLTLSIIRYGSRVKWSNPGEGVAPSPTPWCSSHQKGGLQVTLDYNHR